MKRGSIKKWFGSSTPESDQSGECSKSYQRQVSEHGRKASSSSFRETLRKGSSFSRKFKFTGHSTSSGLSVPEDSDCRAVTPPLATEEDLQENEKLIDCEAILCVDKVATSAVTELILSSCSSAAFSLSLFVSTSASGGSVEEEEVSSPVYSRVSAGPSSITEDGTGSGNSARCGDIELPTLMMDPTSSMVDVEAPTSASSHAPSPPPTDTSPDELIQETGQMASVFSGQSNGVDGNSVVSSTSDTPTNSAPLPPAGDASNDSLEEKRSGTSVDDASPSGEQQEQADSSPEAQAILKRKYVLMELVETERDYVRDLGSIVDGYIATINSMELPEDMKGKERIVFANIQQIWEFHKNLFCADLEKSLDDYNYAGSAFVKYERRLHMYVVYCQNKPKSEFLVSEYENFFNDIRTKLGHKLNIGDLLIKPVQRIMKYQLLLKDILKYTERATEDTSSLKKALQVMHVVPKACDDMMHVGRLQGFDGKITAQGKLLHQGTVMVSDCPSSQPFRGKERRVFLFEQSVIIAECILPKKEYSNPTYIFKQQIAVNKMALESEVSGEPLKFIFKNRDTNGPSDVVLQASSLEEKQDWITHVKQLLDTQMDFLKALQHPIAYQKQQLTSNQEEPEVSKKCSKGAMMNHLSKVNSANGKTPQPFGQQDPSASTANSLKCGNDQDLVDKKGKPTSPSAPAPSPKSRSKLFASFRNKLNKSGGSGNKSPPASSKPK